VSQGGITSIIAGAGDVWGTAYDGFDRAKTETDPLANQTINYYDPASNVGEEKVAGTVSSVGQPHRPTAPHHPGRLRLSRAQPRQRPPDHLRRKPKCQETFFPVGEGAWGLVSQGGRGALGRPRPGHPCRPTRSGPCFFPVAPWPCYWAWHFHSNASPGEKAIYKNPTRRKVRWPTGPTRQSWPGYPCRQPRRAAALHTRLQQWCPSPSWLLLSGLRLFAAGGQVPGRSRQTVSSLRSGAVGAVLGIFSRPGRDSDALGCELLPATEGAEVE
jgi:YD repeat-containing protein